MQEESSYVPPTDKVGILTASVLLTFTLTHILSTPEFTISIQLPGFYFAFPLSLGTLMTVLAAGLTAAGMDWLLRSHPSLQGKNSREHWLLPTLTSFVVGITLAILPNNAAWWITFGISAILLALVFIGEYVVVEPATPNYALARAGLTALSYALFLILITALRLTGVRLIFIIPALFVTSSLIALRILHLDGTDRWDYPWAAGIGLICTQFGTGLHYWPLTALQFGLILTGLLYSLSTFSANITEGLPMRRAMLEPGIILTFAWGAAVFFR